MRAVVAVVVAAGLSVLILGCATERIPEFSAEHLGESSASMWLNPEERAALERAGIATHIDELGAEPTAEDGEGGDDAFPDRQSKSDKTSQALMSLLGVSISLGMAVAPFLLF